MTTMTAARRSPSGTPRMTPGHWILLAVGVPVALALIGWTGFTLVALVGQASFPIADTIPVTNGQLTLNVGGGDLAVHVGNSATARLAGRVHYSLIRPDFTEDNTASGTTIGLGCRLATGNCGLNATLDVPPRTAVKLSSGGGDLSISGVQASETLYSEGGDMTVSGGGGPAALVTGGGDLNASDLAGTLSFSTSGGDIGGSDLGASTVTADSAGGDVSLVFTQVPHSLVIESSGGDINVVLPSGNTGYDVTTSSGGGDVNDPITINSSSPDKITVTSGGGGISLTTAS